MTVSTVLPAYRPEDIRPDFIYMSPAALERSDFVAQEEYQDPIEPLIIDDPGYAAQRTAVFEQAERFTRRMLPELRSTGIADRIIDLINAKHYRAGTRRQSGADESRALFRTILEPRIQAGEPVEFVLPAFPFKLANPVKVARREPDMAEVLCLSRMYEICQVIKAVYPPGARFCLISDGVAYAPLFGVARVEAELYRRTCIEMINELGFQDALRIVDLQYLIDARGEEFAQVQAALEPALRVWWRENPHDPRRASIIRSAASNLNLSRGITHDLIQLATHDLVLGAHDDDSLANLRRVRSSIANRTEETAFRFVLLLYTLRETDLIKKACPGAIRATVHPKPGQWAPHLVNRDSKVFPWQGIAVRDQRGHWRIRYEFDVQRRRARPVHLKGDPFPFYYDDQSGR